MRETIRILFLSANPWTTSRILVDEESREIFERLQEGPCRDAFDLWIHMAVRGSDLQKLLMMHRPHIVHFSAHGSKSHKLILSGAPGKGKEIDRDGLTDLFSLYSQHVRLVFLNACFTRSQALSLSQVIDYAIGSGKGIGDRGGVAFAAAFYRALSFGGSVRQAFRSAKAELGLTRTRRAGAFELFGRNGLDSGDAFPTTASLPFSNQGAYALGSYRVPLVGHPQVASINLPAPNSELQRLGAYVGLNGEGDRGTTPKKRSPVRK